VNGLAAQAEICTGKGARRREIALIRCGCAVRVGEGPGPSPGDLDDVLLAEHVVVGAGDVDDGQPGCTAAPRVQGVVAGQAPARGFGRRKV